MSVDLAFETFGIPGILIFGLGILGYKLYKNYTFSIASNDFLYRYNSTNTLPESWVNGDSVSSGEHYDNSGWGRFAKYWRATPNDKFVWKINIPREEKGDVFVYKSNHNKPKGLDNEAYYFRVKIKNLNSSADLFYQQKCFYGTRGDFTPAAEKPLTDTPIIGNGVHIWEPICNIGTEETDEEGNKRMITHEQLGIYIKQKGDESIDDLIIEEAYIGEKCWKINLLPFISEQYCLIVKPRDKELS